ncbi:hypothetical protein [Pseudovibrio sp. Ad13]|uniref:hypothetical protein n=1 Tax=Pseudovibrio sp. Ad13 TaxID=989396 RepID=UPI00128FF891|nr:hypothetical protein [Pseudovibrio sp. Ad13]
MSGWFAGVAAIAAAMIAYSSAMKQVRKLGDQISEAQKANRINQIEHIASVMEFCSQELYLVDQAYAWVRHIKRRGLTLHDYRRLIINYNSICAGFDGHNINAAKYNPGTSYQERQRFLQKLKNLWVYQLNLIEGYDGAPIPLEDFALDTFRSIQTETARCLARKQKDPVADELLELEHAMIAYNDKLPDNWMDQLHTWREGVVNTFMENSSTS